MKLLRENATNTLIQEYYSENNPNIKIIKTYVDNILRDISCEILNFRHHSSHLIFTKPSFMDYLQEHNPFCYDKENDPDKHYINNLTELSDENIENLIKNKSYHLFYDSGHVLFDADGLAVPTIYRYDYIGTYFTSYIIDIEKSIKVLKNHPWVVNKKTICSEIVPAYNRDDPKVAEKYFKLKLLPDKETYNKFYQESLKTEFFSTTLRQLLIGEYIENPSDPLGIKQFKNKNE